MSVVAEGVEDPTELALLAGMGCDTVQGFLISRPVAADVFMGLAIPAAKPTAHRSHSSAVA
jgi:EAL domain-containing protein (putative c-di-GMP-specific phosphodiesterase class I)